MEPDDAPDLPDGHPTAPWHRDRGLVSTAALAVISLCAVFVSVYQAHILGKQQEVMAQQQRIMTESARAQLWPRLSIGLNRSFDRDRSPTQFELVVENEGTGPAIVEEVRMTLDGKPMGGYRDLWRASNYPDTAYAALSNARFTGTVVQAGEDRLVFGLTVNPELMRHFVGWLEDTRAPWTVEVCYRSVFDERFVLTSTLNGDIGEETETVETCPLAGTVAWLE